MSKREDIIDPHEWTNTTIYGLDYSEVLGWIDIGHAQGTDIAALLADFRRGEASNNTYYRITYTQKMYILGRVFGTGKFIRWDIKRGRSVKEIHSIALAMMMHTARMFEDYQSQWYFNWYSDSGFSGEDLTSDLLGFYRIITGDYLKSQLRLVSKENALKRWDYYGPIGNYKNKGFQPLLFNDPTNPCVKHAPYNGHLPSFMRRVSPYTDYKSDNVRIVAGDGTYLSFYSPKRSASE